MSYRTVLVYVDHDPLCGLRTTVATRLARELDAHLTGVAPTGVVELSAVPEAAASLAEFASGAWDRLRDSAELAAQRFREACRRAGVPSYDAFVEQADRAASLIRHAHCADLVVLSQPDPGDPHRRAAHALLEQVLMHAARPALLLPYGWNGRPPGARIMVAWDDSREAARALGDALPLLHVAQRIDVVSWHEPGGADDGTMRARHEMLRAWLHRHGVNAETHVEAVGAGIADAMLSRAADLGVDLIVMGAWGHARWAERLLGGATQGLLGAMTVPVLMSH